MSSSGASSVTNSPSRHSAHSAQGVLAIPGSPVAGGRFVSPHIGSIDSADHRQMDADLMDEKRKEHIAYEYLCHLEEAKKWIESCTEEELPATTDLEQALRNGVILCKLGHYYAPEVLPLRRIYDLDEVKYQTKGLHFKHTDNFNFWLNTLRHIGLPKIFYPTTTDLYDRKNMPRVIYCIHALSLYLHKLGKAPLIQDLLGTATFTEEEISTMKRELDKYGITIPSFGKIGGILTSEMSVDQAAIHAAIMAINEVLEKDDPQETLVSLQNPCACLGKVEADHADRYHTTLLHAKRDKAARSGAQNGDVDVSEKDVYDFMLTQEEIQDGVDNVNTAVKREIAQAKMQEAVANINQAIQSGSLGSLLRSLQTEDARLNNVVPENMQWYMDVLSKAMKDKAEASGAGELGRDEIQDIVNIANEIAEHTRLVEAALVSVNNAVETGDADQTLQALQSEHLDLYDVFPPNKQYYQDGLLHVKREKAETASGAAALLTEDEIQSKVAEMNSKATHDRNVASAVADINQCIVEDGGDPVQTELALKNEFTQLGFLLDESCVERYHIALQRARQEKGEELTQEEIKKVIEEVNEQVRLERLHADAVCEINAGVSGEDPATLLECLHSQHAGLQNVQDAQALHYLNVLKSMKAAKAERTGNPDAELTVEEIQNAIDKANTQTLEAIELAKAVSTINAVIDGGDPEPLMEALTAPSAGIRSVTAECAESYQEKLSQAKQEKVEAGVEDSGGWSEHCTREGYNYYYNSQSGESQWERPEGFSGQSQELSREEIQAVVTKVTADYDRWTLMKANEPLIVQLQSHWRGALVRRPFRERMEYLRAHEAQAVQLQAHWKGYQQKKAYQERLQYLRQQAATIVMIQSWVRMWRVRSAYRRRLRFFMEHAAEVVKIQAFWRAKKAKRDYKQLVEVDQPPTAAVRRFLDLLEQSDIDFSEELECQRLKAQVVQEIRSNQQQEQDLSIMDIKIGLLVRNRLSVEDVVSHTQQVKRKEKKHRHVATGTGDPAVPAVGVGGLSKANQEKIENYQHLFYLLQTHPDYFAKLIFEMPQSKTNRFMENVILTVFNYAQNNREQFLLIKLFERALKEEIESKVDKILDIITGNPTVIKMVIHYTRGERGQNVLRELLGPLVKEVLGEKDLVLHTGPVDVYRAWINQMETQTGEATKLPYDVSNDQALEHEEVRMRIGHTIQHLRTLSDRFQQSILDSLDKIPYAMRYIAMQLRLQLHAKFPETPEDDILKVVGNLLYYRYMNPAIVAPDGFDIVDVGMEQQLSPDQRRNLGSIAKVLQHAAACKLFEGENAALSSMNPYIKEAFGKFKEFFLRASTVPSPEEKLGIDEYSDVTMLTKPVIFISIKEICSTHSLLIDHEDAIAPDPDDPLHGILKDLGPSPSVESLLGGVRDTAPGEDKQDVINEAGKQEIPLTLTNKVENLAEDDSSNMKALFVRTKRMVVDVLRVQPGENLTEVLYTPATTEQEEEHQLLVRKREQSDQSKFSQHGAMKKSDSMSGDRNLPLEGMKRKIMRNLRTLEQEGMVNSKNDYQEIINAIARDIRNQHRYRQQRKQELTRLQETLDKLSKKASFYEEQMDYFQRYVKACLDSLAKAGSKGRVRRGQGQEGGTEFKRQSVKYTAQKLFEKGVILEIEGLPNHQFRNVVFEISSIDVGVFEVSGRFLGRQIEKVELVFQDLLQLQYEGLAIMKMFERAKINVNLLIYLINKKFYGRV